MQPVLVLLVILGLSVGLLSSWRRNRKLLAKTPSAFQNRSGERTKELEKDNEDLRTAQAELQRRWQYLAEAHTLSHSGTFGWKVSSGELVWSDETYKILGFTRETNRIAINGMLDDQQAPFGGFKQSGVGREFGTFGIEAFLEPRAILE